MTADMFNCLVVDDEPIARDILKSYCSHLPMLHVTGYCGNALEAKTLLEQRQTDILFLDIHMPVLDGIGFLKTLRKIPQVIFTTAYKEYAAEAFDLYACDYLVKPFSFERFIIAVDRATERLNASLGKAPENNPAKVSENRPASSNDYFFVKADGKIYQLAHHEFLFAEAKGNYTRIVTTDLILLPNISFTAFEALLPGSLFLRVHRSFIVSRSKITRIEGNTVYIGNAEIPIGSNYKESFLKALGF